MPRTTRPPAYRHHKPRNLAVVTIHGKDIYLGPYGSPESRAKYAQLIADWEPKSCEADSQASADVRLVVTSITVSRLLLAYLKHAETYYRKEGRPTGELKNILASVKPLKDLYGSTAANAFRPKDLKAVRDMMIATGLSRGVINSRVGRIKRAFRWATVEGLVDGSVYHALAALPGLKYGRSTARETKPIPPVAEADVELTSKTLCPMVRAMVNVQLLTAMRPQEVRQMRTADIDQSGDVWVYLPRRHKTQHHGHVRRVAIGPKAQEFLRPLLDQEDPDRCIFCPRMAVKEQRDLARQRRKTPMTPSQLNRRPKGSPRRTAGLEYSKNSYTRAIKRAAEAAGVNHWHPHQLRHTCATRIRARFGIEAASVVLGHKHGVTVEIYAEADFERAKEIMREIG